MIIPIQRIKHKLFYTTLKSWKKLFENFDKNNEIITKIINYIIFSKLTHITDIVSEYLASYYANTYYIAPVRATAERYYRVQNLSLDEVDHRGMNLAMFIKNMSKSERDSFQTWTYKHFNFKPDIVGREGHVSIQITTSDSKDPINLADTGFGYSQILPIITQLWFLTQKKSRKNYRFIPFIDMTYTFIIEQPELHLHPAMQAQMVSSFVAAIEAANKNNLKLNIIFETHSRTIINTLGRLIDESDLITSEDVNICVVEKEKNCAKLHTSKFDEEGYLENWPIGFFDPTGV